MNMRPAEPLPGREKPPMAKKKVTQKMILKEISTLRAFLADAYNRIANMEGVFEAYVKMQKDTKRFQEYLEKENERLKQKAGEQGSGAKNNKGSDSTGDRDTDKAGNDGEGQAQ